MVVLDLVLISREMLLHKMIYLLLEIHKVMPISYKQMIVSGCGTVAHGLTVVQFKVIKVKKEMMVIQ